LSQDGLLCGTTSHLTNFAILLGGGGGSGALDDPCKAGQIYMLHDFDKHIIILACVTGSVLLAWLVVIAFVSFTKPGRKLLYGKEGYRVQKTRTRSAASESSAQTVDDDDEDTGFA
jgi:hypothetical protein